MKDCSIVIDEARKNRGMSKKFLSDMSGVDYKALQSSLGGDRKLTGNEVVACMQVLGMTTADFED